MLKIALALGGGYLAVVGLARMSYRSLLYPAPRRELLQAPRGATLRSLRASDGEPVQVLMMEAPKGARTFVHFHGNGEVIADAVPLGSELARRGFGFVAVEYRGYGGSPAESGPSEEGLYADAEGVLATLRNEGIVPEDVVLWGTSLGSGVAVEMAARGHGARLVLFTPFTSIVDVAARMVPVLPARLIIGDRYDNLGKAPRIKIPTLVVHGNNDALVPYDMGVTLARTIDGAELVTIDGGTHNDLFVRARERLFAAIVQHAAR